MNKYIFKYNEKLSGCCDMILARRGDDLSLDQKHSFPIETTVSTCENQEETLKLKTPCINPGPFVSTCSFVIKPKETVMIVYDINNTIYDINAPLCFGENLNEQSTYQTPQECLCLFNNSNRKRIYVRKGYSLVSLIEDSFVKNHVVYTFVKNMNI